MTDIIAVIPARLGSTRLARKVLADIHGHPLIWHVWSRVMQAARPTGVYIATDADEVADAARGFGANVIMTSPECRSGTERIAQAVQALAEQGITPDGVINVQGDEPLVDPGMIDALIASWDFALADLITPVFAIHDVAEIHNPNIVKVARDARNRALYFSRSPIPYVRDTPPEAWLSKAQFWGHIGVYGYTRAALLAYPALPVSALETAESLEQLRFLDAGYAFQTFETNYRPIAVDVQADLERVRGLLA
ncbi:MAG: 3-deoxy-manno-octulosonate cytidylyltransferase [bacterium]|nr:3-deoxy-manno-octulosonate cytidylyltransferase [bacterium]